MRKLCYFGKLTCFEQFSALLKQAGIEAGLIHGTEARLDLDADVWIFDEASLAGALEIIDQHRASGILTPAVLLWNNHEVAPDFLLEKIDGWIGPWTKPMELACMVHYLGSLRKKLSNALRLERDSVAERCVAEGFPFLVHFKIRQFSFVVTLRNEPELVMG